LRDGAVTDVEDLKRAEDALRGVGIDVSTGRMYWSEELARIYDYAPGTELTLELICSEIILRM
jgi:hypothetical protein